MNLVFYPGLVHPSKELHSIPKHGYILWSDSYGYKITDAEFEDGHFVGFYDHENSYGDELFRDVEFWAVMPNIKD
jgi:hypothetical protein